MCDVVVTSFDVLRSEINYTHDRKETRLPKKYIIPHTPLMQLKFWRVVVDEGT
jgi:hypothetical protein